VIHFIIRFKSICSVTLQTFHVCARLVCYIATNIVLYIFSRSRNYFTTKGQSVSQSVCLGVKPTLGLVIRYDFLSERCCVKVSVLFLWGALSDERNGLLFEVCTITQWSESCRTRNHTLLSHLRLPSTRGARFKYLYLQGTGWPSYTPGHWAPFTSPLTTHRATVEIF
jgi:hypothetical protein